MDVRLQHLLWAGQGDASRLTQPLGEVWLQCRQGHAPVLAGVDAVARMPAANGGAGLRQAPLAGQAQVGCRFGQGHLQPQAGALGTLVQHGLQHRLGGHERPAHVGVERGGQVQPGDEVVLGHIRQVVARLLRPRARCAYDLHQAQRGVALLQCGPVQTQLGQGRRAERGDEHVGGDQQVVQGGLAFGGLEVGADPVDASVHCVIRFGAVTRHRVARPARGSDGFELGATGPHLLAAHQCGGAGQVECQAQDVDTVQDGRDVGHVCYEK